MELGLFSFLSDRGRGRGLTGLALTVYILLLPRLVLSMCVSAV